MVRRGMRGILTLKGGCVGEGGGPLSRAFWTARDGLTRRLAGVAPESSAQSVFNSISVGLCTASIATSATWSYVSVRSPKWTACRLSPACPAEAFTQHKRWQSAAAAACAARASPDSACPDAAMPCNEKSALQTPPPAAQRILYTQRTGSGATKCAHFVVLPESRSDMPLPRSLPASSSGVRASEGGYAVAHKARVPVTTVATEGAATQQRSIPPSAGFFSKGSAGELQRSGERLRYITGPGGPWLTSDAWRHLTAVKVARDASGTGVRFVLAPEGHAQASASRPDANQSLNTHSMELADGTPGPTHAGQAHYAFAPDVQQLQRSSEAVSPSPGDLATVTNASRTESWSLESRAHRAASLHDRISNANDLTELERVLRSSELSKLTPEALAAAFARLSELSAFPLTPASGQANPTTLAQLLVAHLRSGGYYALRQMSFSQVADVAGALSAARWEPDAQLVRMLLQCAQQLSTPDVAPGDANNIICFAASLPPQARHSFDVEVLRQLWPRMDDSTWSDPHQLLQRLSALAAFPNLLAPRAMRRELQLLTAVLASQHALSAASLWDNRVQRDLLMGAAMSSGLSKEARRDVTALAMRSFADSQRAKEGLRDDGLFVEGFLGLLQAVRSSRMASSPAYVGGVIGFLEASLPEMTRRIEELSPREVALAVASLADVLVWQGKETRIRCDAAMGFMQALLASRSRRDAAYSADQLHELAYGLRHLFGVHRFNEWCTNVIAYRRQGEAEPSFRTKDATVWGKAVHVPGLQQLSAALSAQAVRVMHDPSVDACGVAEMMLKTLSSLQMPYLQMVPYLRAFTDVIHAQMGADVEAFGHRRVAHIVQSLGQLGVPFQKVSPLVRRCMLRADSIHHTFDLTSAYLMVDGMAKMRVPTPKCATLLHSLMDRLASGLAVDPLDEHLHQNILSCPPSQLLKLMVALKGLVSNTTKWQRIEFEPQQVFMRAVISHLARERLPELGHTDVERLLDLMAQQHLGGSVPRPWRLDISMRSVDNVAGALFDAEPKASSPTQFWTGLERYDSAYTGTAATPPAAVDSSETASTSGRESAEGALLQRSAPHGDAAPSSASSAGPRGRLPPALMGLPPGLRRAALDARTDCSNAVALHVQGLIDSSTASAALPSSDATSSTASSSGWEASTSASLFRPARSKAGTPRNAAVSAANRSAGEASSSQRSTASVHQHSGDLSHGRLKPCAVRVTRPFRPHDAISLSISMANLWRDATPEARRTIRGAVSRLASMYPPQQHAASKLAQLFWVLPRCGIPWAAHGAFLDTALTHLHSHLHAMRPRDVHQVMKGLRMMAELEPSDYVPPSSSRGREQSNLHSGSDMALRSTAESGEEFAGQAAVSGAGVRGREGGEAPDAPFPPRTLEAVQAFVRDASLHLAGVAYDGLGPQRVGLGAAGPLRGVGEGEDSVRVVGLGEACLAAATICREQDVDAVAAVTSATLDALHLECGHQADWRAATSVPARTLAGVAAGIARTGVRGGENDASSRHGIESNDVRFVYDLAREGMQSFDADAMRTFSKALVRLEACAPDADILVRALEWVAGPGVGKLIRSRDDDAPRQLLMVLSHIVEGARAAGFQWKPSTSGRHGLQPNVIPTDPGLQLQLQMLVQQARCAASEGAVPAPDKESVFQGRGRPWRAGSWQASELAQLERLLRPIIGPVSQSH